jgi:NADPH2:quinone reductase
MQAIVVTQFGGPEVMKWVEVERPQIGPHQLLIRVEASSVNFADIKARFGGKDGKQPPFIPGIDCAGTIEEVGAEVKDFNVGQRVIAFPQHGSYAEYAISVPSLTFPIPDGVDFLTAAACPIVSFTSYALLNHIGRIQPGDSVLIHAAAGGIGTTAIQMAKLLGAEKVIGTVSRAEKASIALNAGADVVVDTSSEDFVQATLHSTDGKGADLILDSIAGPTTEQGIRCLASYGRLVQFGNASGEASNLHVDQIYPKCQSVLGFSFGTTRKQKPHLLQPISEKVLGFIMRGELKIFIGRQFPLEQAADAHRLIESRGSQGKIVLIPPGSSLR